MKFLAIFVAIFFYRNWYGDNPIRANVPFRSYQDWFMASNLAIKVRYVVCVGLPVLLILILAWELKTWLFGLIWLLMSLLVLFYAIEECDTTSLFETQITWLRSITSDESIADLAEKQEDFLVTVIYELFQSIVPVIFWFLLAGPAGALLYALTLKYLNSLESDDPEVEFVEQVVFWLEWLPTRLAGLLFVFVGNFGPSFKYWLDILMDVEESNAKHLHQLAGVAAQGSGETDSDDIERYAASAELHLNEIRDLLERATYGWLGIAALVTIIGW